MTTNDVRIAVRTLRKSTGFTAAVLLTLGLGLTLAVAVFSVVNAYLLRGLPYPGATRLYSVHYAPPGADTPADLETLNWRSLDDVIEHPIAWDLDMFYLLGGERAEAAPGAWVTRDFVEGLGVRPALGRGFDAAAFEPGGPQVALISHRLWQQRFGGDAAVVGRRFDAYVSDRPEEAESFTIVGVLAADFWHTNAYTDILAPLRAPTYPYMVRLRDGASPVETATRITALVRGSGIPVTPEWRVWLTPLHEEYAARVRPALRAVSIAAALVLLVSWANVAGLLLIRATRRQKEIAVRMALGASRGAIARLLMTETVLLAAGAAVIAVAASALAMPSLGAVIQRQLGRTAPGGLIGFSVDRTVIAGAAIAALLTALACGLAPLAASWRLGLLRGLRAGSRSATEGRGTHRLRSVLIALEVAASLALIGGSTLMARTVMSLVSADLGVQPGPVVSASMTLRQRTYPDPASRLAFFESVIPRIAAINGVESVGLATSWPLQPLRPQPIEASPDRGGATALTSVAAVTADYFPAMTIAVAAGRGFTGADRLGSEPVAIVSESLSRRLWHGADAIGAQVFLVEGEDGVPERRVARRIVGIVRDVRQSAADVDLADLYVPLLQTPGRFATLYARTTGAPAAVIPQILAAFTDLDPQIPVARARPLQEAFDAELARPKFMAWLLGGFAVVAALLALIGVYGVIAYAVRQREREIAVRLAIGAAPRAITALFLKEGSAVLAAGVVLGILGAIAAGRTLESQLFGVRPADPLTLTAIAAAFAATGFLAIWWPARRAGATDPAVALQDE